MSTLSVVITAYNEEKKIANALESVKGLADEIIVVNNSSTDRTAEIAKKYTKKVFSQKNDPTDVDRQKNFGFSKATKEWTLSLDADERVTPELAEEIREKIKDKGLMVHGYWIPRKNIVFGKWIEHSGWYPDYQMRLFQTGKGKFVKEHVHEDIQIEGQVAYVHTDLIHDNFNSVGQFISRNLLQYAKNEAKAKIADGYIFSAMDGLWFPLREFMSRYFAREGYKDGLHGFVLSLFMAAYHLAIFGYIWEEKNFTDEQILLSTVGKELEKAHKEIKYWLYSSAIESEKNPLKKTILKAKRKTSV